MKATVDEHGIVSLYNDDGSLYGFCNRADWDRLRASFNMPPWEPEPVVSGGQILYGIPRSTSAPAPETCAHGVANDAWCEDCNWNR